MAVTHADLAPGRQRFDLGSKHGVFIMVLSLLFGLCSFVLCLVAEASRSLAVWKPSSEGGGGNNECIYNGNGKTPLTCSAGAFLSLATAMVIAHAYMLVAVSQKQPPALITWTPEDPRVASSLTWQAGFFFITTWICFAVGEVLLMIGLGVESGHLTKWSRPRSKCLIAQPGLFLSAGVFGLTAVFLASGLYLAALRAQRLCREEENVRREVRGLSVLFASPPRSPRHRTMASILETSRAGQDHLDQPQQQRITPLNNKLINSLV